MKLGRVLGVDIGFHYSWIVIAVLMVLSLAGQFGTSNPAWPERIVWIAAILTGVLFFASILVHELSHVIVARGRGLPVRSITLFALGGVAQIERDATDAKTEFWMGIIGPITSLVIGLVCLGLARVLGAPTPYTPASPPVVMLGWLGYINVTLAAFNMLPGFPLDGGRVLRGIAWWVTRDGQRATRIAIRVGQFVSYAMIGYGLFTLFTGSGLGALWLAMIGWFLLEANRAELAKQWLTRRLHGMRVRDVMRPFDVMHGVGPDVEVTEALEAMGEEHANELPVVSPSGGVEGMITRDDVLLALQSRA